LVLLQSSLLHRPQQLDGEERMSTRMLMESLPEFVPQPIRFGFQQGLDELSTFCLGRFGEIHDRLAMQADELIYGGLQRVALAVPAQSNLVGPIGAQDQNRKAADAPT
jgi:hypothetical protein